MELSKTDFIQYLNCPNSLWLLSNKPGSYPHGEFTEYAKKLAADAFLVEDQVRALVNTYPNAKDYSFQQIFETHDGLYAKADMC